MRALFVLATLAISGAMLGLAGHQASQPPTASDDDDEAAYLAKVAERQLEENCLICHEADMITRQRLTPIQWKAEVEKMILWGAPLPSEAREPLTDYLARLYSDRQPLPEPRQNGDQGDEIAGTPGSGVACDSGRESDFRPAPLCRELCELPWVQGPRS